jgi:hypothetical protein
MTRWPTSDCDPAVATGTTRGIVDKWTLNGTKFERKLGELPFATDVYNSPDRPNSYATIGGPYLCHPQNAIYSNNVHNIAWAFSRIDESRVDEQKLQQNNLKVGPTDFSDRKSGKRIKNSNRGLSRYLNNYFDKIKEKMRGPTSELSPHLEEVFKTAHIKEHHLYKARVHAWLDLCSSNHPMLEGHFMGIDKNAIIKSMLKMPEIAKLGKNGRMLGDFSIPGSLLAAHLIGPLKQCFSERYEDTNCVIYFAKSTDASYITDLVTDMLSSEKDFFIYFSDDMICRVRDGHEWRLFNLDISSCDKSNGQGVFSRLADLLGENPENSDVIARAIEQCALPLEVRNPSGKKMGIKEKIVAWIGGLLESSGTSLTTILNNIAAASICLSIAWHLRNNLYKTRDITERISKAAFAVGYKVTCEKADCPAGLQFLKMSFYYDPEGRVQSYLNLGAIIRSFGTAWMDYPYNRRLGETLEGAVRFRNWSTLQSYKHSGETKLYTSYLAAPSCQRPRRGDYNLISASVQRENRYRSTVTEVAAFTNYRPPVPFAALNARYGFSECAYDDLCKVIAKSDVGDVIHHTVTHIILARDYGYTDANFAI